ncbi:MAG TPA: PhnD/SsuA/transferrin family substrate-binding protein [Anaerolineales bacterium]|nr:PhnD/SsuA/transferrin family substrate-binding protein [Anaerolineales bacterium]
MNRKIIPFIITTLSVIALLLTNCNLPQISIAQATATSTASPTIPVGITPTDTAPPPFATAELGLAENPLILVLPPNANSQAQIDAAKVIASQFTERTGYAVVTIVPESYTALIEAFEQGNAHMAVLDPLVYALAYQRQLVQASYAVLREGEGKYGAQFLASRRGGFVSHFDEGTGENLDEAPVALLQFAGKKPCWSDETSPSGYVVPLGYLNQNQIVTRPAAFVEGHPTVVRSLYASGICDFGATYIDALKFPSLEDEFPDLLEQVIVVWQIPPIIPYEVLAFSTKMPQGMRELFASFVPAIMQTEAGSAAFQTVYEIEELQAVNDGYYEDFHTYVTASGLDLLTLIE